MLPLLIIGASFFALTVAAIGVDLVPELKNKNHEH
jgi:hypothetical protein